MQQTVIKCQDKLENHYQELDEVEIATEIIAKCQQV